MKKMASYKLGFWTKIPTRLSTERSRLARGTSPRSWVQKKCLLPGGILIFFFQKIPDFENSSWIFFHLEKFLKFFDEIRRIISI